MSNVASYLIVQHLADPFRREAQNVGVFARINDGDLKAKFFGEKSPGEIDLKKIRSLPAPRTYAEWVSYWRRTMSRSVMAWDEVKKGTKGNYQIVDGGMLDGIGADSIDDVLNYLYSALVSEGGIASALGAPDETVAIIRLAESIEDELKKRNLTAPDPLYAQTVKNPVIINKPVKGAATNHIVSFYQMNGHPVVAEPIDLGVRDKMRMRDRAGWASLVFEDIKNMDASTETIALISATADEEKSDTARYAMSILELHASEIINWQSDRDRIKFLKDREASAFSV